MLRPMYGMEHLHMHPAAQKRMDEEVAAHLCALDGIDPYNRPAVAAEMDRHADRVYEILREFRGGQFAS